MNKKIYEYKSFDDYKENNKEVFKEHKATFKKLDILNDCIITFERPDSSEGAMKFIYIDGVITVQGDFGYAVYNWHNPRNHILAYGGFNSFGYVLSKLEAVNDNELYGWDYDFFTKEFNEFIKDRLECGYEIDKEHQEVPYGIEGLHNVATHFQNSDDYGEDLYESGAYTLGQYVNERPYLWWYGLQTALSILEKEGVFDN